ncbi:MAG TPA: ChbG/HpnK family deacetylase [Dongiaceae bacterium]|nr:ChbG/HpnK family deacetylase [Dongiaceae bacterium]
MAIAGIVLCADDYGIAPGVSQAIRDLLGRGRLSATSCMVVSPDFTAEGPLLRPFLDRADIGLHLTLTLDRPLGNLMRDAYLRRLDSQAIAAEIDRQIESFSRALGRAPDFIDGHQHVHLLPGVREPVLAAAKKTGAYLRVSDESLGAIRRSRVAAGKSLFLSLMARPMARLAASGGIRRNSGFRGGRSFAEREPFRALFQRMIDGAPAGTIVMCHPGLVDAALVGRDPVTAAREDEYRYFQSEEFPADLAAANLRLCRLKDAE